MRAAASAAAPPASDRHRARQSGIGLGLGIGIRKRSGRHWSTTPHKPTTPLRPVGAARDPGRELLVRTLRTHRRAYRISRKRAATADLPLSGSRASPRAPSHRGLSGASATRDRSASLMLLCSDAHSRTSPLETATPALTGWVTHPFFRNFSTRNHTYAELSHDLPTLQHP